MHHSFYRFISPNYLIINYTHILSAVPFIFLPILIGCKGSEIFWIEQEKSLLRAIFYSVNEHQAPKK